ncbi:uncharacterized protein LOC130710988 [Lotus japonicus]|uniref:uncharacterized protein LOC130710988 n=1 Tax=Lotus japonicus TaxID=34305 RepID=UPI00258C0EE0|nr:uncharacterized protein LOC130710988 [Lotus japonicus]
MGCASSKGIDATAAVYRPPPTSFAVFDINSIEEPWLKHLNNTATDPLHTQDTKQPSLPAPILHLLEKATEAPQSWDEVSKVLHDLKPIVEQPPQPPQSQPQPPSTPPPQNQSQPLRKNASFHTLEELDAKSTPNAKPELKKSPIETSKKNSEVEEENRIKLIKTSSKLKDNIFIKRDMEERKKEESESVYERLRRDPLSQFPEKSPPGGADAVVIYTTSLRGVRKTFEDCNRAREVLEGHRVVVDERDVALHSGFLKEVKELLAEEVVVAVAPLPRVFVKGRYLGGLEELVELNESGRLGRILNATRVERGVGRYGCDGCGGARFVPCLDCGGSCKLVLSDVNQIERCPKCNENGLVHCPACA